MKKILLFLLFVGLFYSTDMNFSRLSGVPTLNAQTDAREICTEYEVDKLIFCSGYYNDEMYLRFYIKDYTYSTSDSFRIFFDLNNNNQNDGGEPLIILKRDGTVSGYSYGAMEYYIDGGIGKSLPWKGEITIPFDVLNLVRNLEDKTVYGPNISVSAYDNSLGIIGEFPFDSPVGPSWARTYSVNYWSNPKPISISKENLENVESYPVHQPVEMMKIKIITNNEELYKITNLKIQANGTNANEQIQVNNVNLYSLINENKLLLSSGQYDGDDGSISFDINEIIIEEYTESNPYYFLIEYNISNNLKLDVPADAVYFNFSLVSVSAKGIYTDKNLTVNGLPFNSILLTGHECNTDEICKDNEYCENNWCTLVIQKSDCGYVSNHEWFDYECCENDDCVEGNCIDHICIVEPEQPNEENPEEPKIEEPEMPLNESEIPSENNTSPDEDPIVEPIIVEDEDDLLNETEVEDEPKNETNGCISENCTNYIWENCECYSDSNNGVKKGICIDNCNKTNIIYKDCFCETVDEKIEEIKEPETDSSLTNVLIGGVVVLIISWFIFKSYFKK